MGVVLVVGLVMAVVMSDNGRFLQMRGIFFWWGGMLILTIGLGFRV